jgi:uncharacterized protein
MRQKLPVEIDPLRLAQNGLKLNGELLLKDMPRLCESLVNEQGSVKVDLAFDLDEINTPFMKGGLLTDVSMRCERCMSPMVVPLSVNCLLAIVTSESKVATLAEQYEPWLLESNEPVSLNAVIEDELILALPIVPRHNESCLPSEAWSSGQESEVEEDEKPTSPFAILSSLKNKQ